MYVVNKYLDQKVGSSNFQWHSSLGVDELCCDVTSAASFGCQASSEGSENLKKAIDAIKKLVDDDGAKAVAPVHGCMFQFATQHIYVKSSGRSVWSIITDDESADERESQQAIEQAAAVIELVLARDDKEPSSWKATEKLINVLRACDVGAKPDEKVLSKIRDAIDGGKWGEVAVSDVVQYRTEVAKTHRVALLAHLRKKLLLDDDAGATDDEILMYLAQLDTNMCMKPRFKAYTMDKIDRIFVLADGRCFDLKNVAESIFYNPSVSSIDMDDDTLAHFVDRLVGYLTQKENASYLIALAFNANKRWEDEERVFIFKEAFEIDVPSPSATVEDYVVPKDSSILKDTTGNLARLIKLVAKGSVRTGIVYKDLVYVNEATCGTAFDLVGVVGYAALADRTDPSVSLEDNLGNATHALLGIAYVLGEMGPDLAVKCLDSISTTKVTLRKALVSVMTQQEDFQAFGRNMLSIYFSCHRALRRTKLANVDDRTINPFFLPVPDDLKALFPDASYVTCVREDAVASSQSINPYNRIYRIFAAFDETKDVTLEHVANVDLSKSFNDANLGSLDAYLFQIQAPSYVPVANNVFGRALCEYMAIKGHAKRFVDDLIRIPTLFQVQRKPVTQAVANHCVQTTKDSVDLVAHPLPKSIDDIPTLPASEIEESGAEIIAGGSGGDGPCDKKRLSFNVPDSDVTLKESIDVFSNKTYSLEKEKDGKFRAKIKMPNANFVASKQWTDFYQNTELISRVLVRRQLPDVDFASFETYAGMIHDFKNISSNSDAAAAAAGSRIRLGQLLASSSRGADSKARSDLLCVMWRCFSLGGKLHEKLHVDDVKSRDYYTKLCSDHVLSSRQQQRRSPLDFELNVSIPAFVFPHGIADALAQQNFCFLMKDAALHAELGLKLDHEINEIKAYENNVSSWLPPEMKAHKGYNVMRLYIATGAWLVDKFVYYNKTYLGTDLIGSDKFDSMILKFEHMFRAYNLVESHFKATDAFDSFVAAYHTLSVAIFDKKLSSEKTAILAKALRVGEDRTSSAPPAAAAPAASFFSRFMAPTTLVAPSSLPIPQQPTGEGDDVGRIAADALKVTDSADQKTLASMYDEIMSLIALLDDEPAEAADSKKEDEGEPQRFTDDEGEPQRFTDDDEDDDGVESRVVDE